MTTTLAPSAPPTRRPRRKGSGMNRKPRFAIAVTAVFFVLLYLPIFAVILFSFNNKKSLTVFEGWSLRWYQAFFDDAELIKSLQTSLTVAAVAMVGLGGDRCAAGLRPGARAFAAGPGGQRHHADPAHHPGDRHRCRIAHAVQRRVAASRH